MLANCEDRPMKKSIIAVAGLTAALALGACGESNPAPATHPTTPAVAPPTSAALAAPSIICADIRTDLAKAVRDLKAEDKQYQEAWVSGPDGNNLQALISDTQNATTGDQLSSDAATFNSDASTYLSDNNPYLAPGWQTGYDTVTSDINALAVDCQQPTAPPS
jgi:hypothetical protein